jgi:small subunit ribosomal protein S4
VVFRLGLAKTRRMARQIVNHGHIRVNDIKVDIPSYQVKVGDKITLRKSSEEIEMFKGLREGTSTLTPKWLSFDAQNLTGSVVALPTREDIDLQVQENMIVEFYSR